MKRLTQEELVCASVLSGDETASLLSEDLQRWSKIAQAQLKADKKWLMEPCTEHKTMAFMPLTDGTSEPMPVYYKHRYLCLECMKELEK